MFVIVTEDRKCVVKGKTRKYLCGMEEPTRKDLVTYRTARDAKSAIMRMWLLKSDVAQSLYGDGMPKLEIVEAEEGEALTRAHSDGQSNCGSHVML